MKCPVGIFIVLAMIALGVAAGVDIGSDFAKPLIREESVVDVYFNGGWGIEYQYYVNGELCTAFIRKGDLEAYKAYLTQFGRFAKERAK